MKRFKRKLIVISTSMAVLLGAVTVSADTESGTINGIIYQTEISASASEASAKTIVKADYKTISVTVNAKYYGSNFTGYRTESASDGGVKRTATATVKMSRLPGNNTIVSATSSHSYLNHTSTMSLNYIS